MSPQSLNRDLGLMLKQRLRERSLSLRQFSELAGVDAATVSRIINGKRKATTEHMTRFADCLGIPVSDLFEAAGYPVRGESSDLHTAIDQIQDVLESSDSCPTRLSIDQIRQQLAHYEQYSHTVEGKETIASRFQKKLQKVSGAGPFIDQLKEMLQIFRYNKCTLKEQALIGSALLYFIATIDVIPDYLFPIGYLDDAVAVNLVVQSLKKRKKASKAWTSDDDEPEMGQACTPSRSSWPLLIFCSLPSLLMMSGQDDQEDQDFLAFWLPIGRRQAAPTFVGL